MTWTVIHTNADWPAGVDRTHSRWDTLAAAQAAMHTAVAYELGAVRAAPGGDARWGVYIGYAVLDPDGDTVDLHGTIAGPE